MTKKVIEWETRGTEQLLADARKILEAQKAMTREEKELARVVDRLTKEQLEGSKKLAAAEKKRFDDLKRDLKAASLAAVAAGALFVKTYAEQEAALGRLERAFATNHAELGEFAKAQAQARANSAELGVSYQEQMDGLAQLIDASGSATTAQKDLNLAINIAAAEGRDLAYAVELLRKARDGETEELKNLNGINKDAALALGQIANASERGTKGVELLTKSYEGAAKATAGSENKIKAWKETGTLAASVAGKVAVQVGTALADAFATLTQKAIGADLSLQGVTTSLTRLDKFTEEADLLDWIAAWTGGEESEEFISAMVKIAEARKRKRGSGAYVPSFNQQVDEVPSDEKIMEARTAEGQKSLRLKYERGRNRKKTTKPTRENLDDYGFLGGFGTQEELDAMREHKLALEEFEKDRTAIAREGFEMRLAEQKKYQDILQKLEKEHADKLKKAEAARYQSQVQGMQFAGQALGVLGGQRKEAAYLQGLIASAEALLHASHGNLWGAGQAGLAAVAFFQAAGKGSGGGGASRGGGGAAASLPQSSPTTRRDADLLATRPNTRSDAPFIVQFHSNFAPTPQQAQDIAEVVRRANRNAGWN